MELYVDFEEVVARASPSFYPANQHYDEIVPSSYPVSLVIFCFAIFILKLISFHIIMIIIIITKKVCREVHNAKLGIVKVMTIT